MTRAFVVGGGVAGLVAAFGLRDRGHAVTLLESRRWLGGRAFSSSDAATGRVLDNGPHVMLGCYRATRALLHRIGVEARFERPRSLTLAYRAAGGVATRLSLAEVPVPFAMPLALLRLPFSFGAKVRALRGMIGVLRGAPRDWSLADWLARRGQKGPPDSFLWRPLCRAVMNVEPEHASAAEFLATLREAFLGGSGRAAIWVPRAPLGELFGAPAARALVAAGVDVLTGARVAAIECEAGAVKGIVLGAGERIAVAAADVVVSALPWFALHALLPDVAPDLVALPSAPITTAFVASSATAPPLPDDGPVVALVDGDPFHFVARTPGADPRHFGLLSGGNRVFDGMNVRAIEDLARAQIARHYPGWNGLDGAAVRIRKEQHATFVASPGSRRHRPPPGRAACASNLWLCGDWTDTGLPATLEGAARSAEAMLTAMPARS